MNRYFKNKFLALLILFAATFSTSAYSASVNKGFEALAEYDYFKAKKIFIKAGNKKPDPYASYGLAVIFMRTDNPFHNLDSATKYVNLSFSAYRFKRTPLNVSGITVDSLSILKLADTIAFKNFQKAKQLNTITACDHFLRNNYLGRKKYTYEIIYLRDELEFNTIMQAYNSDSTREFIITHPQSIFLKEAGILYERQQYDEMIQPGSPKSYIAFIKKYPKSIMVTTAYEKLFTIYRQNNDAKGLADFVHNYPSAPQNLEAWKLLFSLTVKTYSYGELKKFIEDYPRFPLKNSILKDLELNKLSLYPVESGDYMGFIDSKGSFLIKPIYDEASPFSEGLSVVSRNDSVFFINKENINVFHRIYAAAGVFKNGIAPVKLNSKWYFINRQGQSISKFYDEINELSDGVYVVKAGDKYGALDQYGQLIIEPQFAKLGDFKNGIAYYQEGTLYGFVSVAGSVHKAEFDWISDFGENKVAVFRQGGKFGLITSLGKRLLEPKYEMISAVEETVYLTVSDGQYGFFNTRGCFSFFPAYDYLKDKPGSYYHKKGLYRLIRKNEQAMADSNGKVILPFGAYDEFGFPAEGFIHVKQKNRHGFLDAKKMTVAIPLKYQMAGDFNDGAAIVMQKDKNILIDNSGREKFSSEDEIRKITDTLYFVDSEPGQIISRDGVPLVNEVDEYTVQEERVILKLSNGEIKLLNN